MKTERDAGREVDLANDPHAAVNAAESGTAPELPPDALIIIPLRHLVLFPGMIAPISLGRQSRSPPHRKRCGAAPNSA